GPRPAPITHSSEAAASPGGSPYCLISNPKHDSKPHSRRTAHLRPTRVLTSIKTKSTLADWGTATNPALRQKVVNKATGEGVPWWTAFGNGSIWRNSN
ncbi:hypothetical protein BaRGS_00007815, partial [Batillaria attramentaria]